MTHDNLFRLFPRPWRVSADETGAIKDATGAEVLQVDTLRGRTDEAANALAELLARLGNSFDIDSQHE